MKAESIATLILASFMNQSMYNVDYTVMFGCHFRMDLAPFYHISNRFCVLTQLLSRTQQPLRLSAFRVGSLAPLSFFLYRIGDFSSTCTLSFCRKSLGCNIKPPSIFSLLTFFKIYILFPVFFSLDLHRVVSNNHTTDSMLQCLQNSSQH